MNVLNNLGNQKPKIELERFAEVLTAKVTFITCEKAFSLTKDFVYVG